MKKQLLTIALLLSTGIALQASPQASAAEQARNNEGAAHIMHPPSFTFEEAGFQKEHKEELIDKEPRIGTFKSVTGPYGSGQRYRYENDHKWHLVGWSHGLPMSEIYRKEPRHPFRWRYLTPAQEQELKEAEATGKVSEEERLGLFDR